MKSTFKVLFYLKKDKISKDGKVPVMGQHHGQWHASRFQLQVEYRPGTMG